MSRPITEKLDEACELYLDIFGVEGVYRKVELICKRMLESLMDGNPHAILNDTVNIYMAAYEMWKLQDSVMFEKVLTQKVESMVERAQAEKARSPDAERVRTRMQIKDTLN